MRIFSFFERNLEVLKIVDWGNGVIRSTFKNSYDWSKEWNKLKDYELGGCCNCLENDKIQQLYGSRRNKSKGMFVVYNLFKSSYI